LKHEQAATFVGPVQWQPAAEDLDRTHQAATNQQYSLHDLNDPHRRTVDTVAWFPSAWLDSPDVRLRKQCQRVLDRGKVHDHTINTQKG
jgi:hypothetical protein